jgi:hypothetical protein
MATIEFRAPSLGASFFNATDEVSTLQELNQEKGRLAVQELELRVARFRMFGTFLLSCLVGAPGIAALIGRSNHQLELRYLVLASILVAVTAVIRKARHSKHDLRVIALRFDRLNREIQQTHSAINEHHGSNCLFN